MINKYEDIINLPRHISKRRSPMDLRNRAAQFSPFAALTGHDAAVRESARLTEDRVDLDQYMKDEINYKLQILKEKVKERPKVKVGYFQVDEKKDGGRYIETMGVVKKICEYEKVILMVDGRVIDMDKIVRIEGKVFVF